VPGGRPSDDDETTFDDVAMILLCFFLVLVFWAFNVKFLDLPGQQFLKEKQQKPSKQSSTEPGVKVRTHGELDFLL